jgi:hypothetical protein
VYKIITTDHPRGDFTKSFNSYDDADAWLEKTAARWRKHGYTIIESPDELTTVSPYGFWTTYKIIT